MQVEYLDKLKKIAVVRRLYTNPICISHNELERDQRKQGRVIREAMEEGYLLAPGQEEYPIVTNKAYDEVEATSYDLIAAWNKNFESGMSREAKKLPFVRVGDPAHYDSLTPSQVKGLMEDPDVEWFIIDKSVYELYQTFNEEKHLFGPFKAEDLPEARRKSIPNGDTYSSHEIVVTSAKLREYVEIQLFRTQVEELYPLNVAWHLTHLGVLEKPQAEEFTKTFTGFGVTSGWLGASSKPADPSTWEANFNSSIETLHAKIAESAKRLAMLQEVQKGIAKVGGWNEFMNRSKDEFIKAFKEQNERRARGEEETPATEG